jgi:hypothetical protein
VATALSSGSELQACRVFFPTSLNNRGIGFDQIFPGDSASSRMFLRLSATLARFFSVCSGCFARMNGERIFAEIVYAGICRQIDGVTPLGSGAQALNEVMHTHSFTGRSDNFDPTLPSASPQDARLDTEAVRVSNYGRTRSNIRT